MRPRPLKISMRKVCILTTFRVFSSCFTRRYFFLTQRHLLAENSSKRLGYIPSKYVAILDAFLLPIQHLSSCTRFLWLENGESGLSSIKRHSSVTRAPISDFTCRLLCMIASSSNGTQRNLSISCLDRRFGNFPTAIHPLVPSSMDISLLLCHFGFWHLLMTLVKLFAFNNIIQSS